MSVAVFTKVYGVARRNHSGGKVSFRKKGAMLAKFAFPGVVPFGNAAGMKTRSAVVTANQRTPALN